jgi:hypothetical protein
MPAARRPPPPVQVDFGRIAAATAFHATAASPTSKSGAFTSELLALKETGKISHKHSFLSRINSQESDYRYLEMQVDQTISVPIAQLRADAQVLEASIELQAQARRLLKRTVYCELFPWCEAAPMHPADRMRLPALLPSAGNCHTGTAAPDAAAALCTAADERPSTSRLQASTRTRLRSTKSSLKRRLTCGVVCPARRWEYVAAAENKPSAGCKTCAATAPSLIPPATPAAMPRRPEASQGSQSFR